MTLRTHLSSKFGDRRNFLIVWLVVYALAFIMAQLNNLTCLQSGTLLCYFNTYTQIFAFPMQFDLLSHFLSGLYFDGSRLASVIIFAASLVPLSAFLTWLLIRLKSVWKFAIAYSGISLATTTILWCISQFA